ncbi:MAG: LAGLIDADG family homing endonuclease [bacterium]|nr:LAGLIDADG family homing endonuclease [bacterium]
MKRPRGGQLQHKVRIKWSPDFAYAIGLLTADGCLSKDGRHIQFSSSETTLVKILKKALSITNKPTKYARGGETEKKYFFLSFGDKVFYSFLITIGLCPAKSKVIKSVKVPDKFFSDFLRGLYDGDGTFYAFWDRRWQKSFCFKLSFASASKEFILWLKKELSNRYDTTGYIHKGAGVFNLEYVKGDSKKIVSAMYYKNVLLFLPRKYRTILHALKSDTKYGIPALQKQRNSVSLPG